MQARRHCHRTRIAVIAQSAASFLDTLLGVIRVGEAVLRDVYLIDVQRPQIEIRFPRLSAALLLTRSDRHRRSVAQPAITFVIVGPQRFFEPADLELGERVCPLQCRPRVPNAAGVDQHDAVVTDALARAGDKFDVEFLALTHRLPAEFDRAIAVLPPAPGDLGSLLAVLAEQNRRIRLNAAMLLAAEQPMNRLLEVLAL